MIEIRNANLTHIRENQRSLHHLLFIPYSLFFFSPSSLSHRTFRTQNKSHSHPLSSFFPLPLPCTSSPLLVCKCVKHTQRRRMQFLVPQSPTPQRRTIKTNGCRSTCKNCRDHFSLINSPRSTTKLMRAKSLRMGNKADYCSVDCQSSHAMKTMYVYQDLMHFKQMQEQGDSVETNERVESGPRTMSVDFKSTDEVESAVRNGIAHKLQETCVGSPRSSPSKHSSGGECLRGNVFRELNGRAWACEDWTAQHIWLLRVVSSSSDSLGDNMSQLVPHFASLEWANSMFSILNNDTPWISLSLIVWPTWFYHSYLLYKYSKQLLSASVSAFFEPRFTNVLFLNLYKIFMFDPPGKARHIWTKPFLYTVYHPYMACKTVVKWLKLKDTRPIYSCCYSLR